MTLRLGLIICLFSLRSLCADDAVFRKASLGSSIKHKLTPVRLTLSDTSLQILGKGGSGPNFEIAYTDVTRLAYGFLDRRRVMEGIAIAWVLALTKSQSHWLLIEAGGPTAPKTTVLRLDKSEFRAVIATLNARSGKHVEVLDPDNTSLDPTAGSHDEDATVPFPMEQVVTSLKAAMESVGCKVNQKQTKARIECYRGLRLSDRGGEAVRATVDGDAQRTHVRIHTRRGLGRDWSSPIFREMRHRLESLGEMSK